MSGYDRPRSMADMVVEQATAAPGEVRKVRAVPLARQARTVYAVCPCCNASLRVELDADTVVDL